MARTDEVLFASVTRGTFEILGLFDHSVFDWSVDDAMPPERERLWSSHDEYRAEEVSPGAVLLDGYGGLGITTAGTPIVSGDGCDVPNEVLIREIDPKLSDSKYVETLFAEHPVPKQLRL